MNDNLNLSEILSLKYLPRSLECAGRLEITSFACDPLALASLVSERYSDSGALFRL